MSFLYILLGFFLFFDASHKFLGKSKCTLTHADTLICWQQKGAHTFATDWQTTNSFCGCHLFVAIVWLAFNVCGASLLFYSAPWLRFGFRFTSCYLTRTQSFSLSYSVCLAYLMSFGSVFSRFVCTLFNIIQVPVCARVCVCMCVCV